MILLIDLADDSVSYRPDETRTLDVREGFDRRTATATFDAGSRVHCFSIGGEALLYRALTRPLSSRGAGEECLVADGAFRATAAHPARYPCAAGA